MILGAIAHSLGTILGKGQHTIIGTQGGRQLLELVRETTSGIIIHKGFALDIVGAILAIDGELDGFYTIEQILVPLAERYRIDINTYRLTPVNELIGHAAR